MVFNATFNNISVIWWWSVLLVEETTDLSQVTETLSHNVVLSTSRHERGLFHVTAIVIVWLLRTFQNIISLRVFQDSIPKFLLFCIWVIVVKQSYQLVSYIIENISLPILINEYILSRST
jgi:hypothetical protein